MIRGLLGSEFTQNFNFGEGHEGYYINLTCEFFLTPTHCSDLLDRDSKEFADLFFSTVPIM